MSSYDAIVLGTGGVGSAAAYHLAQRGLSVLGLDQYGIGHNRGSSHGQTRIIRQAYFEHPDYVPLVRRAYRLWDELAQQNGERLFHQVGLLEVGPPGGLVIPGVMASVQQHGLSVDQLTADEISRQFPAFRVPPDSVGVFEHDAGYLMVERCVLAHVAMAKRHGAEFRDGETVIGWRAQSQDVTVTTDCASYTAAKLIVSAGAWTNQILQELYIPLRILAKHLHWYASEHAGFRAEEGAPTFFYELPEGYFYGFPRIDNRGLKIGEHSGGTVVSDPSNCDRSIDTIDRQRVDSFMSAYLPAIGNQVTDHSVCMYTMSPDEHFIVDLHPEFEHVAFAAGLSGHGFKFTCVLGEALADLALKKETDLPIHFLRSNRPSLGQNT